MNTNSSSTIHEWLINSKNSLSSEGIDSARIDSLLMLEMVTGMDRAKILANPNHELNKKELKKLKKIMSLRIQHYPMSYITGKTEFYGNIFSVNKNVLIPRPETEEIINQILLLNLDSDAKIADIGTGSGCIGITIKLLMHKAKVDLYDISKKALKAARMNARKHNVHVGVYRSDLLKTLRSDYDVVIANLPYVPKNINTGKEIDFEPKKAIFAENEGMAILEEFWIQIKNMDKKPRYILTESLDFQHDSNNLLATNSGYSQLKKNNLTQVFIAQV